MSLLQTADVERILAELSDERPVFHSEADFQFALALKMQQLYPPKLPFGWRERKSSTTKGFASMCLPTKTGKQR